MSKEVKKKSRLHSSLRCCLLLLDDVERFQNQEVTKVHGRRIIISPSDIQYSEQVTWIRTISCALIGVCTSLAIGGHLHKGGNEVRSDVWVLLLKSLNRWTGSK